MWSKILFIGFIALPLLWMFGFYFYQVKIGIPRDVDQIIKEIKENRK